MSKQQNQVTTLVLPDSPKEASQVSTLVKEYVYHWPLFLLGVIITLIAAYYYLLIAKPVYPITAAIQFTNRTTETNQPVTAGSLDQLNLVSQPIKVDDEINVIKSKKNIYQVVQHLQLWINYSQKQGLQTLNLYKTSPVVFSFTDTAVSISPQGEYLNIVIQNAHTFTLEDKDGQEKSYSFTTPVKSAFGTWLLKPTTGINNYTGQKITISIQEPDLVTDIYQQNIKIEQETKNGAFLNLSMSDELPNRGRDILNLLTQLYQLNAEKEKHSKTEEILRFMDVRLDSIQQQLDSEEVAIQRFKQQQGFSDISMDAQNYRALKEANTITLNDVNVKLSTLNTLQAYANSAAAGAPLPPGGDLDDNNLTADYNRLSDLQSLRQQKLATIPAANPIIVAIDTQISILKRDFSEKIRQKIETMRSSLLANKEQLSTFNNNVQTSLGKVPAQQKMIDSLIRDEESKKNLYRFLSDKREQLSLQYVSLLPDFKIVDDAHAGKLKWPIVPVVYGLALLAGLALAAGVLAMRKMFNERIESRKQIEDETEVPVLAEISAHAAKEAIVVSQDRVNFVIGEQFRILRTNLYYLLANLPGSHVTLFSSSVSGEGKSFISSNLSVTMAYGARKTIILEMDLRKPKLLDAFGLSSDHTGISNYLAGETSDISQLIRPSGYPGLDVLGSGPILPNPSELLETDRLDMLIKELKTKYDEIVIDSPPIHLVTDALIIARLADVCLYVVRQDYTHKDELGFIKEIYNGKRFSRLNLLFNGVKKGGAYGYGYGNYNYSYYNAYAGKQKWNLAKSISGFFKRF